MPPKPVHVKDSVGICQHFVALQYVYITRHREYSFVDRNHALSSESGSRLSFPDAFQQAVKLVQIIETDAQTTGPFAIDRDLHRRAQTIG